MESSIYIRKMKPADLGRVIEIEKISFADPWSESAYLTEISNASAHYSVLCIGKDIVGFAGMWVIIDEAHITTLAVDPDYRKKRMGERLLIDLLEEALARSATRATLEVRQSNVSAQNLYIKYDFKPVAIRREYYSSNNENAVIMWVDNISSEAYRTKLATLKHNAQEKVQED